MRLTNWQVPIVLLALAAGGCGSSPPVTYYNLEALETGYVADGESYLRVGVGPLRTPDYLSRSQIVTRDSGSRVSLVESDVLTVETPRVDLLAAFNFSYF